MRVSSARRPVPVGRGRRGRLPAGQHVRAFAAALVLLLSGVLLAACSGEPESAPKASPTPISRLNTSAMEVPRIDFCPLVPKSAVSDALGGRPDQDAAYGNGDEATLPGVGADVVHEIGCSWSKDDGTTAGAWVFARPVDTPLARRVIAAGKEKKGCRTVAGPSYGDPSATQVCRLPGGESRVRHSGLFGQTWLTCQLSAKGTDSAPGDLRQRADRWCVEVVNAVNTAS